MRTCKNCKTEKELTKENFYIAKKYINKKNEYVELFRRTCKECDKENDKLKYRNKSKEEKREIYLKAKNRYSFEERQDFKFRSRYGISLEDFNNKLNSQNNLCDSCGTKIKYGTAHLKENNGRLDHCHKTGKVRGIICHNCNTILGMSSDSLDHLKKVMEYLKKWQ